MKICNYNDHPPPNSLQTCNKNDLIKYLQNNLRNKKVPPPLFLQKAKEILIA